MGRVASVAEAAGANVRIIATFDGAPLLDGFRIAEGFVEVVVRPDKAQARAAAEEVTREFEAGTTSGFRTAGDRAGHEFATSARSSIGQSLEAILSETGDKTGASFVEHVDRVLSGAGEHFKKTGEDLGEDLLRGITGRTSTSGGGFLSNLFTQAKTSAGEAWSDIKQGASAVKDAFGMVSDAASTTFSVMKWPTIIASGLELIPPVLYAIGGGLASIPALAVGAGLALASLELGTQGIGAAIGAVFNPTGGGGGGAAGRADALASAERNLASAERNEMEAQQALNDARVQAAFHLQDLNLQMERQQENERGAALAIKEAQAALVQAEATGDPLQIMRAQLALQEANTGLKEQQQQTVELAYEKQQADQKGIEGSDQVVAALDRVTAATNGVLDAQAALRQASVSAAAGTVTAYSKLSPEAKKFVDEIARLKPELVGLQQYVQDRLFVGLDKKLDVWAHEWIPHLRTDLGLLAGDANTFSKRLGDDLSKPAFVTAIDHVADAMDRVFSRFTNGGALDKGITALGDLIDKATPFVEALADSAVDKLGDWADRLDKAAKDGDLDNFFKEASKDLHDIYDIGSDAFDIIGQIMSIAMGADTANHNGKNGLDRLKDTLDQLDRWVHSDTGKQDIKEITTDLMKIGDVIGWVIVNLGKLITWIQETNTYNRKFTQQMSDDWRGFQTDVETVWDTVVLAFGHGLQTIVDEADRAFKWVPGLGPKLDAAKRDVDSWVAGVNQSLNNLKSHTIDIQLKGDLTKQINSDMGHTYRWGGIRWADEGLVSLGYRSAGVYGNGPLIGFAEPDTGGEIFIPKNGDRDRNQALATIAAQWAGMQVTPARSPIAGGMGISGTGPSLRPPQTLQVHVGGEHLADVVLRVVEDHVEVVSAAAVKGDRRRHFTNSARS